MTRPAHRALACATLALLFCVRLVATQTCAATTISSYGELTAFNNNGCKTVLGNLAINLPAFPTSARA